MTDTHPTTADAPDLDVRIATAYQMLVEREPFEIKVSNRRKTVRPHALSASYPVMNLEGFTSLVEDVASYGFVGPAVRFIVPGVHTSNSQSAAAAAKDAMYAAEELEVLDGRLRVAVAWALDLSVNGAYAFAGSEEEADALVDSMNVHRRHFTAAQAVLMTIERLLPAAKQEAKARMLAGKALDPADDRRKGSAAEIAAGRSHGLVTSRNIEKLARIVEAPKTRERIFEGKVTAVDAARKEMLTELGEAARGVSGQQNPVSRSVPSVPLRNVKPSEFSDAIGRYRVAAHRLDTAVQALTRVPTEAQVEKWIEDAVDARQILDELIVALPGIRAAMQEAKAA